MELKPGSRWKSAVCDTEVELQCGGHAMLPKAEDRPEGLALSADHSGGSQMGKRFADEASGIEVLCVAAGAGSLAIDGRPLGAKEAKKLPASD
jgi:hypothetical protein